MLNSLEIAAVMTTTGVMMLAYVVSGVPRSSASGSAQGDIDSTSKKPKKKKT